ncbi:putative porin [Winogradskyella sp. UBA3174]|uniref:putative porin n=1 Tax=Winogradskyella sp. UBA3174 TaxID=1947785 RepID=UPI0025F45026|nr:putative porin [Winogradskyella sp. UBA3174]|tara:strand:+ start:33425 stop:35389 length:1965 start_codon:yes stop_codon:yes gene_type:complete
MQKYLYLLILLLNFGFTQAQVKLNRGNAKNVTNPFGEDSSKAKKSNGFNKVAPINLYLQFNRENDSSFVDTTLSINKHYKFNYLQKDNFGLMPFANIGQSYNSLTFNSFQNNTIPVFGARARHFNYLESDDIRYYEVPTPWTRLTYKTAFEQGQMLDAFLTLNLSKQFNFSIAYKGLRSLGNYQNTLTSSRTFRFTTNYKSKNKRYQARGHIVNQNLLNQENGGLSDEDIENFDSGNEDFIDRSVFDPTLQNAENILVGKRFVLNHSYNIIKKQDSTESASLTVFNTINFEDKYYQFYEDATSINFFGDILNNDINDRVTLETFNSNLGVRYNNKYIGDLSLAINYNNINYGYDTTLFFPGQIIPNRIKNDFFSVEARFYKKIKAITIKGNGALNLSDTFKGNSLNGEISYTLNKDLSVTGGINVSSTLPNYNYLLYQSDYINYNWYNFLDFENIRTQQLNFKINSDKYLNIAFDISNIDNYTYFSLESIIDNNKIIKPKQYSEPLQYLRLKAQKEFKVGNFALDNTIMYQNILSDEDVLNVPDLIIRNTLYYTSQLFKKAMTLQTGVTLNYFTEYKMNGYDPLLAEFYTQNETSIGGFPRLDFFINVKIRQTRIFLKAEHFNSSFTGYNYFSAPNNPYRDFSIRFGIVWDFFL